jgi:CHAT domain
MRDHLGTFVAMVGRPGNARDNLIAAADVLVAQRASEYSRALRSLGIDFSAALRAAPDGWRPDARNPGNLASTVMVSAIAFTRDLGVPDASSAALVHALLRSHAEAVPQMRLVANGYQPMPALTRMKIVARATTAVTRAAALSWALPPSGQVEAVGIDMTAIRGFAATAFGSEVLGRARRQWRRPDHLGPLSSKQLLRAALALGSDQRIATWLQALGLHPIDISRGDTVETHSESLDDAVGPTLPILTLPALQIVGVAQSLASMADQSPDVDRLLLAALVTPGSFVWREAVDTVGTGVNLPLLFIRSGRPSSLTRDETALLVAVGDAQADLSAAPMVGDLAKDRIANLALEAASVTRGYDSAERLRRCTVAAGEFPTPVAEDDEFAARAVRTGGLRYFALASEAGRSTQQSINDVFAAADLPQTPAVKATRTLFDQLVSEEPVARLEARENLAAVQPDRVSRHLLMSLRPSLAEDCVVAASDGDARRLRRLLRLQLTLGAGEPPPMRGLLRGWASLCIGGGPAEFGCALASDDGDVTWGFSASSGALLGHWRRIRLAALGNAPENLQSQLIDLAEALGLARHASLLNGAAVDLLVVPPFDALFVDLAIRAISQPRAVTYRVLGGGWGIWQRSLLALERSGGRKLFVADPTASLRDAQLEAEWLAAETGGEVVTGAAANRARVVRSLEAEHHPLQLLHFTGHGVSGIVDADGHVESAVVVGGGEVLTTSALAGNGVPRVLIASACDIGALPPMDETRGWHRSAIAAGVGYSVAASIPIADAGALAFALMLYRQWQRSDNLEIALAQTIALGQAPTELREALTQGVSADEARKSALRWLGEASAADVQRLFSSFSIASV